MTAPARSHLDRALPVGALVALVVVLVLGATEALMRALFAPPLKPYTPHTLYRATRTPNFKQFKTCVEDGKGFDYTIDPLGFRGASMKTAKKPPGTFRIFFVGASTTENQHLPEERTFPALVEKALRDRGAKVEVANCGIAGHGAARSFALIAHRILQLEPDLIVLLEGENDFMQSLDDRWDPANGPGEPEKLTFKDWLVQKSRLVAVLDAPKEVDTRPFLEKRRKDARKKPYFVPPGLDPRRGIPAFEQYLRRTKLLCDDAKVPIIFMTQPTLWKEENSPAEKDAMWMSNFISDDVPMHLDPATCKKYMDEYNAVTRHVGGERVVDLDRLVPHDLEHFYDDAHMTTKGNVAVANAIVAALDEKGLAPQH